MSRLQKLWIKIKNNPKQVRFEELDKILIGAGFNKRQSGGGSSHFIYTKGTAIITVPYHQPHIKSVYVERAIKILEGEIKNGK